MFDHGGVDFSVLASAPPGAELAAVLSRIDLASVNGHVRVLVMAAWERQSSWVSARFYESMAFVARSPACELDSAPGLLSTFTGFASAEVGAALCLSPRSADRELSFAYELTERLPGTHAALAAGAINLGKARTIAEETYCLSPELARVAEEFILAAEAASGTGLSRVQLVRRLRRKVLELDPEGAEERRKKAQQGRRVGFGTDPDGTGYITGQDLPMAGTAAAEVFIKTHAKHIHRDRDEADRRTLAQIEADVFLDLLRGRGPVASPNPATTAAEQPSSADQPGTPPMAPTARIRALVLTRLSIWTIRVMAATAPRPVTNTWSRRSSWLPTSKPGSASPTKQENSPDSEPSHLT